MKPSLLRRIIRQALQEDSVGNDITSRFLISPQSVSAAAIVLKEDAVICGLQLVEMVFKTLDPKASIRFFTRDGSMVKKGKVVALLCGKSRALLGGERVALNFLSHLCAIATLTRRFVAAVRPYRAKIMDTRKTIPGLRELDKYAVLCGGGLNHRLNLAGMVMIKDNHLIACGPSLSIPAMVRRVREKTARPIEVEADSVAQFKEALLAGADMILLDNMPVKKMRLAVRLRDKLRRQTILEASGGITLDNVRKVARCGVDRISIGALTNSVKAVNFSLEFKP